ncbi:hypothetical protein J6590_072852 [Homalodisca vitripennis]|nr:hypothetical protein J6590_072852 [Homalodisca vitripennis]
MLPVDAVCRMLTWCMTHTVLTSRKLDYLFQMLSSHDEVCSLAMLNDGRWWVLPGNVFFQHSPAVGVRSKIGGVGWVRKVFGDETVAKGLLEESSVVNGSVTGCTILLEHCKCNGRFRARQNLLRSLANQSRMALYRFGS